MFDRVGDAACVGSPCGLGLLCLRLEFSGASVVGV